jgi:hypothetical protein
MKIDLKHLKETTKIKQRKDDELTNETISKSDKITEIPLKTFLKNYWRC